MQVMKSKLVVTSILLFLTQYSLVAHALTYRLPTAGEDVVGKVYYTEAREGETLADIGRRHGMGYYEMVRANRSIPHNAKLRAGKEVVVPAQFVLPSGPRQGIVVNLAEYRLYYYPVGRNVVITEALGIGKLGWDTPTGNTKIIEKNKDPIWRPTEAVRADAARQGYDIPLAWPPGPDNPLGGYAMRLGWRTYLIHGTNHPEGVGARVSAGCLRMFPEGIEYLYKVVPVGTAVHIINKPVKIGWHNQQLLIEVHQPLRVDGKYVREDKYNLMEIIQAYAANRNLIVKWRDVRRMMHRENGIPTVIGVEQNTIQRAVRGEL